MLNYKGLRFYFSIITLLLQKKLFSIVPKCCFKPGNGCNSFRFSNHYFMKKQIVLIVCAIVFFNTQSFAWGKKGHALVAEIAFTYLDPSIQSIVVKYLNGRSIQEAANWMDELRDDHSYDYLKPYHYVNFDKNVKVVSHEGDNIIFRLTQTIQELKNYKNLSDEAIKMKICIIFHLVGDLHQPLHVGYGTDKGGNTLQINYNGKGTNLHSFFDSGIINARSISLPDCLALNTYSKHKIKRLGQINTVKWAKESRRYLPSIYDFGNPKISETYVDHQSPMIKKQLLHAGIRLAAVLTTVFGN